MSRLHWSISLFVVGLTLSSGCGAVPDGENVNPSDVNTLAQPLETFGAAGTISASPSLVSIRPGFLGTSRICMTTSAAWGDVYVVMDSDPEKLFYSGPSGSCASATWIQIGHSYEFRVYGGGNHTAPIASATVVGVEDDYEPPCARRRPGPCP